MAHNPILRASIVAFLICMVLPPSACIQLDLPDVDVPVNLNLFGSGTQFVVRGTAGVTDGEQPCPVWLGDNGVTYHLFQDPRLENQVFDRITTPGATSRLVLVTRDDLELVCQFGIIAEVQEVLEIIE